MDNLSHTDMMTGLEIAVIGMAGRFPGARNIEKFWENLKNGVESITFFSDGELEESGIDSELIRNPDYVKAKGLLEDVEYFDARFFDYTAAEASTMDPQLRIFHECSWEALEDAGYDPGRCDELIGLYAGAGFNPYWMARYLPGMNSLSRQFETSSLNAREYLTTRVSYKLNLKGPAVTILTACSTSLVAIHLACQGILSPGWRYQYFVSLLQPAPEVR
jgi:acyl transferase domain-containing protein